MAFCLFSMSPFTSVPKLELLEYFSIYPLVHPTCLIEQQPHHTAVWVLPTTPFVKTLDQFLIFSKLNFCKLFSYFKEHTFILILFAVMLAILSWILMWSCSWALGWGVGSASLWRDWHILFLILSHLRVTWGRMEMGEIRTDLEVFRNAFGYPNKWWEDGFWKPDIIVFTD